MTQPLLSELTRQGHDLTVAALPWVAPVYEAMAECKHTLVLPFSRGSLEWSKRRDWASSIQGQFDESYVCPNSFKSALLPFLAGIPLRVGYTGEMRFGLLNRRLSNPSKQTRSSMVKFYLAMSQMRAKAPEVLPTEGLVPKLKIDAQLQQTVWARFGLHEKQYVAMAPGAEYGDAKRWPEERFCELIANTERPVVLLGSASDRAVGDAIVQGVKALGFSHVRNLAGQTQLSEAMAMIGGAAGLVSNDSGLMHIAAALGVPQVALFGSSSPEHTPALSSKAQMIWLKWDPTYQPALACAPCFKRVCPLAHKRCLWDISAQSVLARMRAW